MRTLAARSGGVDGILTRILRRRSRWSSVKASEGCNSDEEAAAVAEL